MTALTDAIEDEIKKGEALCEKATPGPWEDNGIGDGYDEPYIQLAHARLVISGDNAPGQWDDWEFVQKTRTAYPTALALLRQAKAEIETNRWRDIETAPRDGSMSDVHPALLKVIKRNCDFDECSYPKCQCQRATLDEVMEAFAAGRAVGPERKI